MESPITVLWGNIIHTFENVDASSLKMHQEATASGKLSKSIAYDNRKEKVRTPYADLKTREINLQETYLSHLWAFIYSVFVMYEEGVQKPLINNTFDGSLKFENPLLQRAKILFDWAISLTNEYSEWDEKLPNPRTHNSNEEKFYAEKVNAIFQSAVSYLMFHEFAHLTLNHESFFIGINMKAMSEAELAEKIQMENEADQYAFNMLIKDQDDENQKWVKGLSVLFVMCSALLITSKAQSVKQNTHPDLDNRILSVLQSLNLKTEEAQFYCWYLCGFAIRFFLLKHGIDIPANEYETAQDAFFSYLDRLDDIKNSKSI
ncbi:MAG: phage exclusion protein Lit family protein [Methylococcaceae bacterium]